MLIKFYVCKFWFVLPDSHSCETFAIIPGKNTEDAIERWRAHVEDGTKEVWGFASEWDGHEAPKKENLACVSQFCNCGEAKCASGEDSHEDRTVQITWNPSEWTEHETADAALASIPEHKRGHWVAPTTIYPWTVEDEGVMVADEAVCGDCMLDEEVSLPAVPVNHWYECKRCHDWRHHNA